MPERYRDDHNKALYKPAFTYLLHSGEPASINIASALTTSSNEKNALEKGLDHTCRQPTPKAKHCCITAL